MRVGRSCRRIWVGSLSIVLMGFALTPAQATTVGDPEPAGTASGASPEGSWDDVPEGAPPDVVYQAGEGLMDADQSVATPGLPPVTGYSTFTRAADGWLVQFGTGDGPAIFQTEADGETVSEWGPGALQDVGESGERLLTSTDRAADGSDDTNLVYTVADIETQEVLGEFEAGDSIVTAGFTGEDVVLMARDRGAGLWVWNTETDERRPLESLDDGWLVLSVAGDRLAAERTEETDDGGEVRCATVVDLERDERLSTRCEVFAYELSPDGEELLVRPLSYDGGEPSHLIIDASTGRTTQEVDVHALELGSTYQVGWEPTGDLLFNLRSASTGNALARYARDAQRFEQATSVEDNGWDDLPGHYLLDAYREW